MEAFLSSKPIISSGNVFRIDRKHFLGNPPSFYLGFYSLAPHLECWMAWWHDWSSLALGYAWSSSEGRAYFLSFFLVDWTKEGRGTSRLPYLRKGQGLLLPTHTVWLSLAHDVSRTLTASTKPLPPEPVTRTSETQNERRTQHAAHHHRNHQRGINTLLH